MSLFDRFRPTPEILEHRLAILFDGVHGSITAAEALEIARPIAASIDRRAHAMMLSTASIDAAGRSDIWECGFDSRDRLARVWVNFTPDAIELEAVPLINHAADSVMPALWKRLDAAGRQVYLDGWFEHSPLTRFIGSERAIEVLVRVHDDIDLVSGSTTVSLSTNRKDEAWVLAVGRKTWSTPLLD